MYIVTQFTDSFKVIPEKLNHVIACLIDAINLKYQNKMIEGKGIGVTLYDIIKISDGVIVNGTGNVFYDITFNFVVFSPFVNELIQGKVLRSLATGIQVTLDFTDSIFIDQCYFPPNCDFDEDEQLWYWSYNGTKLYMYINTPIRFKVHHVVMKKQESIKPAPALTVQQIAKENEDKEKQKKEKKEERVKKIEEKMEEEVENEDKCPLKVYGRINESGLGLTSWWKN
ncbi:DNA-directed RNA polymerase III subunit RPC8, putative [Entamoeba invadens IP1]|uniref:DNA-directed RNA polymerase III subunit RPC8, putative n=1 Tax=Entamoeba invadens IP1 TaxID=370355 RepID=UPI0002C3ECAE|nr:DNA-directed RNA polymerase III subunit RPC8, putative [Entamoeba invadens IP1]ELP90416.1 DNA-directed RNA polymerase III subunit RPC8, putative [Entamoeba invadens IP1]|eukprot:XP_004257187.1 DNA-directed RNA polymerase III subunit RPC8, putative [Entamoeba invadens IP1]